MARVEGRLIRVQITAMRASPFQASPLARRLLLASAIVALGACERKPAAPSAESARAAGDSTAPATATPTGAGIGWSPEAGPVLLVQDESGPLRALVVFPDFTDSTLTDTSRTPKSHSPAGVCSNRTSTTTGCCGSMRRRRSR